MLCLDDVVTIAQEKHIRLGCQRANTAITSMLLKSKTASHSHELSIFYTCSVFCCCCFLGGGGWRGESRLLFFSDEPPPTCSEGRLGLSLTSMDAALVSRKVVLSQHDQEGGRPGLSLTGMEVALVSRKVVLSQHDQEVVSDRYGGCLGKKVVLFIALCQHDQGEG